MCGALNDDVRLSNSVTRVSTTRHEYVGLLRVFHDISIVALDRMCVKSKQGDINEATWKLHKIAFVTFPHTPRN